MIHGDACFAYFNKIWGIPAFQAYHTYSETSGSPDHNGKAYGDTHSVERGWSCGRAVQPTSKPVLAAKIGSKRSSKLQCNFNYIRVRSFILTGAPLPSGVLGNSLMATVCGI
jgi:hypothetical protein